MAKDKDKDKKNNLTFEESLEELGKIVDNLESGKLQLEESLKYFEKGIELSKFCSMKLEEVEGKIEIILKDAEGNTVTKPYETEQNAHEN